MGSNRGGNRLKYQVEQAIKRINYIGQSKKVFRKNGAETGIHSITQVKHTLSVGQNFALWIKEQGVKDLYQLKRSHYRDYLAHMKEKDVSNGYLINIETNLRLLQKGMHNISRDKGFEVREWIPRTRLIDTTTREKPQDRSYSAEEIKGFQEKLSFNAKIGADLQQAFGLRLREVAYTKAAHIVEKEGKLFWEASEDKLALNTAQGVTKAGRGRISPCMPELEVRVRELIQEKEKDAYVSPVRYNTLKSAYNRAGMKGSHSYRHTYARKMLKRELQQKGIETPGLEMVQRMLENRVAGYRKDHTVTKEEKTLYREVVKVMDKVQEYLGHGEGRIDLAEVYLKGV